MTGFKQNLWSLYAVFVGDKRVGYVIAETSNERSDLPIARGAQVHRVISGYAKVESYREFLKGRHPKSSLLTGRQ